MTKKIMKQHISQFFLVVPRMKAVFIANLTYQMWSDWLQLFNQYIYIDARLVHLRAVGFHKNRAYFAT